MVIYDHIGILMATVAVFPSLYFNSPMLAGVIGVVVDLAYRAFFRNRSYRLLYVLLSPTSGGQLFFVPIWGWGVALLFWDYLGIGI